MRCIRLDELSSDSASEPVMWPFARVELAVGDPTVGDEPIELGVDDVEHFVHVLRRGTAVDRERAGLLVRAPVREHRIREAALLADSWKSRDDIPPPSTWSTTASA